MSRYNRKGGSGKKGSLREQFNYYKRQVNRRLIDEYVNQRARGLSPEGLPKTLFKNLDYNKIYNEGITRKVGNKTIRYIGEEAVKIQINSLKNRASKSFQAQNYITNYINALESVGFSDENIIKIKNNLNNLSVDKLTYLINNNILPQIYFLYSEDEDEDELTQDIINKIKHGINKEDYYLYKQQKKKLKPLIEKEYNILKGLF